MIHVNFHFMGNILFNYLPGPEAIAQRGYAPLLALLEKYAKVRSHVYCSSQTGMVLKNEQPETFERIQEGVREGRIEIGFNGYEHAAFNCLSPESVARQIRRGFEADEQIWGLKPRGYFPSDCRWEPYAGYLFKDYDIGWIFPAWSSVKLSNPGPPFYSDWRELDPYRPMLVKCPMGARVPAIVWENNNYELLLPEQTEAFFTLLDDLHRQRREDGCVAIEMDFEAILILEVKGMIEDATAVMEAFLDRLTRLDYVSHAFSGEMLRLMPPTQEVFLRPAYWGHFGGAYPDGVQQILSLCDRAEHDLLMCEDLLGLLGDTPEAAAARKTFEDAWDDLLVAQNSEVRFTDPPTDTAAHTFYPTEQLILKTYEHAIRAHETAAALKQRLFGMYHRARAAE